MHQLPQPPPKAVVAVLGLHLRRGAVPRRRGAAVAFDLDQAIVGVVAVLGGTPARLGLAAAVAALVVLVVGARVARQQVEAHTTLVKYSVTLPYYGLMIKNIAS